MCLIGPCTYRNSTTLTSLLFLLLVLMWRGVAACLLACLREGVARCMHACGGVRGRGMVKRTEGKGREGIRIWGCV